jgi:hypothetical protein
LTAHVSFFLLWFHGLFGIVMNLAVSAKVMIWMWVSIFGLSSFESNFSSGLDPIRYLVLAFYKVIHILLRNIL